MNLFNESLRSGESVFNNEDALDADFIPKVLPFRGVQQAIIANCIKPLIAGHNGRNAVIYGSPGIGKTVATRWVIRELEEREEEINIAFVNCWQKNTSYKIVVDILEQFGYRLSQNKRTEELFVVLEGIANKNSAVFVFDEIDKIEDSDFLYSILQNVYKKSVIAISNDEAWHLNIDQRIKSRFLPETIVFKSYSIDETFEILKQRCSFAFKDGVIDHSALRLIASKAFEQKDIRVGLHLLHESGRLAEEQLSRKIFQEHAIASIDKLKNFSLKSPDELGSAEQQLLGIAKKHSGLKSGDLHKLYESSYGEIPYRSFQRLVEKLSVGGFVETEKKVGGDSGTTTIIHCRRKITEF